MECFTTQVVDFELSLQRYAIVRKKVNLYRSHFSFFELIV